MLDRLVERAAAAGVEEVVIGMAHRGRLNVLANILRQAGRARSSAEFEDDGPEALLGRGDVKYHLGFSLRRRRPRPGSKVHLSLAFNPSHLEVVDPVVAGRVRAKQDRAATRTRDKVAARCSIHGDAAFAGQGVVAETLNLSRASPATARAAPSTSSSTTRSASPPPRRTSRSTPLRTDVAKMLQIPIFHVNGEDPEAVRAGRAARRSSSGSEFQRDVVIDLYCYRSYGHNEGDEPTLHPAGDVRAIAHARRRCASGYAERLVELGRRRRRRRPTRSRRAARASLEQELARRAAQAPARASAGARAACGRATAAARTADAPDVETGVDRGSAGDAARARSRAVPEGFTPAPEDRAAPRRSARAMARRRAAGRLGRGEALAFATLAARAARPAHRPGHASAAPSATATRCCIDVKTGDAVHRRSRTSAEARRRSRSATARSPRPACSASSTATASTTPTAWCMWEAQFGDFVNGAQVIIDQFIVAARGQVAAGSPASCCCCRTATRARARSTRSARLERFLELCAEDNIQVVQPHDAGAALPPAPAPGAPAVAQAAGRDDARRACCGYPQAVSPLDELATGASSG